MGASKSALIVLNVVVGIFPAAAQVMLPAGVAQRMSQTDLAVLEAGDTRKDLPCTLIPGKPALGFDLRFHSSYQVQVPMRDLAGSENLLTMLFRVTPENNKEAPVYFLHRVRVPLIEDDARGTADLQGFFDMGEGKYHVDWLMRDRAERVCSSYWDFEATLPLKDRQVVVALSPGAVKNSEGEQFSDEPPVERSQAGAPLNVKLLINYAPQDANSAAIQPVETIALLSIVRHITRDPRIGKFSLVAFNMQEQRVLYRQDSAAHIDFPALGKALGGTKFGSVDLKRLGNKHGETEFLTDLIHQEMSAVDHPDALVFAGPKVSLEDSVPQDSLRPFASIEYPVFYMNFNANPVATPWHDSISRAVRFFKGTEYTISRPRDLWYAVSEMVSRVVKSKYGRNTTAVSSQ